MTLTVCLKGQSSLILASDSRGTFGDPRSVTAQNDTLKKLYLVKNVGILTAGSEHGNIIIEGLLKSEQLEKADGVTKIMQEIRNQAITKFNEWFSAFPFMPIPNQNPNFIRPTLQLSIVGYDEEKDRKVPKLYSMISNFNFTPNLHDYGFVLGGVPQYALYLLNRLYKENLSMRALKRLASYVITETAAQDGKVGGPVQMAVIEERGTASYIDKMEIDKIFKMNLDIGSKLSGVFEENDGE